MPTLYKILATTIWLSIFCYCSETFDYNTNTVLKFSTDTIKFDTLFIGEKSSIKYLKIYNPTKKNIIVNSIYLENNDNQIYLNINGQQTTSVQNVELRKDDSIFVFLQAEPKTIFNNNAILINTGDIFQKIIITSFAIDAKPLNQIIENDSIINSFTNILITNDITINANTTLTIGEGTTFYINNNCGINVLGTLKVNGTLQNPVIFRQKATTEEYNHIPAQWTGIKFGENSNNNILIYATIKNAKTAISTLKTKNITIGNCIIENHLNEGISLDSSNALIYNTLIDNCGKSCLKISNGGIYNIIHCTLANYWNYNYRENTALICNSNQQSLSTTIANSIIYGNKTNEIDFDEINKIKFYNCLIKSNLSDTSAYYACKLNNDPQFVNTDSANYFLKNNSPAIDMANIGFLMLYDNTAIDYYQNQRITNNDPDAGYAEFTESSEK